VEPDNLSDLVIEHPWTHTAGQNPERFLLHDNGTAADARIIVFATDADMRRLAAADRWFMDGNFAMAPPQFLQLYVIHVPLGDTTVPAAYALLQRKSEETYRELFQVISDHCEELGVDADPDTVIIDFELAVKSALHATLGPHSTIQYCFYHLTQSTWRKIQDLGLVQLYREDEEFRLFCGMLDGLAFLPVDDVPAGIVHLRTLVPNGGAPLLDYFDATYVTGRYRQVRAQGDGNGIRMRRVPPAFHPASWNVHHATLNGDPRTNNVCEGWNNKFVHLVGHQHPSVWKCIRAFQADHEAVDTLLVQAATGQPPRKRIRRENVQLQTRLSNLCQEYQNGTRPLPDFLRGVGHLVRF